jgi:AcrR family transcriptional regulator
MSGDDRERALAAGRDVVLRVGLRGLKLDSVLATSGLSTRAFYRHFADKHDLLRALISEHYEELAEQSRTVLASADDPVEGLRRWVDLLLDVDSDSERGRQEAAFGQHWQEVRLAYPDAVIAAVSGLHTPVMETLQRLVVQGAHHVRPRYDAAAIVLLTLTVVQQRLIGRPPLTFEDARAIVWPFVARSLTLHAP